jgi:hypothetical protein
VVVVVQVRMDMMESTIVVLLEEVELLKVEMA